MVISCAFICTNSLGLSVREMRIMARTCIDYIVYIMIIACIMLYSLCCEGTAVDRRVSFFFISCIMMCLYFECAALCKNRPLRASFSLFILSGNLLGFWVVVVAVVVVVVSCRRRRRGRKAYAIHKHSRIERTRSR